MAKLFWQTLKVAPVVFAASLFAASGASAEQVSGNQQGVEQTLEQINNYRQMGQNNSQSQVTNVNQLRDVSPTDWAYEALRSLVDRYGCIAGFPNQTYRGSQALTRYEFAAGLNSCLNQIERLIASQGSVSQEDLDTLNRLSQEFEAELATVGGRVDELESRAAVLEDNQFSTTTKLNGEVIFAVIDSFSDVDGQDDPTETTFSDRVR
ncbi:MAG: iron uptake porin, partial [Cyanobacteria bacterium J06638_38]